MGKKKKLDKLVKDENSRGEKRKGERGSNEKMIKVIVSGRVRERRKKLNRKFRRKTSELLIKLDWR